MEQELNVLEYDNAKVTFTGKTDNIATSDELEAAPVFQDKMGTAYSRARAITKAINITGISLLLTAAAIKTGSPKTANHLGAQPFGVPSKSK